jgi:hypothetical protein
MVEVLRFAQDDYLPRKCQSMYILLYLDLLSARCYHPILEPPIIEP